MRPHACNSHAVHCRTPQRKMYGYSSRSPPRRSNSARACLPSPPHPPSWPPRPSPPRSLPACSRWAAGSQPCPPHCPAPSAGAETGPGATRVVCESTRGKHMQDSVCEAVPRPTRVILPARHDALPPLLLPSVPPPCAPAPTRPFLPPFLPALHLHGPIGAAALSFLPFHSFLPSLPSLPPPSAHLYGAVGAAAPGVAAAVDVGVRAGVVGLAAGGGAVGVAEPGGAGGALQVCGRQAVARSRQHTDVLSTGGGGGGGGGGEPLDVGWAVGTVRRCKCA